METSYGRTQKELSLLERWLVMEILKMNNGYKVIGTFFKEFVSEYKVVFKDISAGI